MTRTTKNTGKTKSGKSSDGTGFQSLGSLFVNYAPQDDQGYITQEFQDYGYRLAAELNDLQHKSLYIKLAKEEERGLLEQARNFVIDSQADNKGALFMWKLKELRRKRKTKSELDS